MEDLAFSEEGLIVNLAKSKTNQLGAAEEKASTRAEEEEETVARSRAKRAKRGFLESLLKRGAGGMERCVWLDSRREIGH